MSTTEFWRKCSSCKKPISFSQTYWICSVSTCNRPRTNLVFCNVGCFDAHIPIFNHRDAGAYEKKAPTKAEFEAAPELAARPQSNEPKEEILVVVSKVKDMIRNASGMNTSDSVMPVLSDHIRKELDRAIAHAKSAGRQTIMERDFT